MTFNVLKHVWLLLGWHILNHDNHDSKALCTPCVFATAIETKIYSLCNADLREELRLFI